MGALAHTTGSRIGTQAIFQRESLTRAGTHVSSGRRAHGFGPNSHGATCQRCGTGTVTLDAQRPDHARPGFTESRSDARPARTWQGKLKTTDSFSVAKPVLVA